MSGDRDCRVDLHPEYNLLGSGEVSSHCTMRLDSRETLLTELHPLPTAVAWPTPATDGATVLWPAGAVP